MTMNHQPTESPLLSIKELTVEFQTDQGPLRAVDHVSLDIGRGEIVGLVGESGCGKSVTALSILRLVPSPPGETVAGSITLGEQELLSLPIRELRAIRGEEISMIFQEPMTALSPLHRIGRQLVEAIQLHRSMSTRAAQRMAQEWLGKVGIGDPAQRMRAYPHELSGGMRQRVMIAMALMLEPQLIIADEPTTALDVTIQAQVFDLILAMKQAQTSMLLITHDMGVVWELCSRVIVMYAGQVVEEGSIEEIYQDALHPYTRGLLATIPTPEMAGQRIPAIPGRVPSPAEYPPGCRFCNRCSYAFERCHQEVPPLFYHGKRSARCFLVEENP
jgi:oligopeptide/dipeptide ABC transporter ATP-binding protein